MSHDRVYPGSEYDSTGLKVRDYEKKPYIEIDYDKEGNIIGSTEWRKINGQLVKVAQTRDNVRKAISS